MKKRQSLEIFAKHFGTLLGIRIEFGSDGPSTDGKVIKLPENLSEEALYPCLGALLHETGHIRLTDFSSTRLVSNGVFPVLNLLEDIRIDTKTLAQFPESLDLYKRLLEFAFKGNEESFRNEPFAMRVLKHLYLIALKYPGYDGEVVAYIKEAKLERFIDGATVAQSTRALIGLAEELYSILFTAQTERIKNNAGEQSKLGDFKKGLQNKKRKAETDGANLDKELSELAEKISENEKELTNAKSCLTRNTNALKKAQETGDEKAISKYDIKVAEAEERLETAEEESGELEGLRNENKLEQRKNYSTVAEIEQSIANIERPQSTESLSRALLADCSRSSSQALTGFDVLNGKASEALLEVEFPASLDETVREVFLDKKEKNFDTDEGYRINARKITGIFTGDNNIFQELERVEEKTVVSFLVDSSGSMGKPRVPGSRSSNSLNAINALAKSITRIKEQEDIPLELSITAFSDYTYPLVNFSEKYSEELLKSRYRAGGGTQLFGAVSDVYEKISHTEADANKIIVVLTDGAVHSRELESLAKLSLNKCRVIYIGLDICDSPETRELFGEMNIRKASDILPTLSDALLESLERKGDG